MTYISQLAANIISKSFSSFTFSVHREIVFCIKRINNKVILVTKFANHTTIIDVFIYGLALYLMLMCTFFFFFLQTWIHAALLLFSVLFYYAFVLLFSITCVTCNSPTNPYGIETKMMSESLYYLVCGLTTVLALLPRYHTHTHTHLN